MTLVDPPDGSRVGTATAVRPATPAPPLILPALPAPSRLAEWLERGFLAVALAATAVSIALRLIGPRALWLDEALTVNISRLPIPQLFNALRHDGSPPLYYLVLHYWMGLFGTGTRTVRLLAATFSLATLPVAWRLGTAVGGRRVAVALVVLLACNPFALRYGTENRMYSLVMLLATAAALLLVRALQRPTFARLIGLGVVCGLLMLAHYWSLYLVAGLGACLLVASVWGPVRARARLALLAVCSGGLLFLPWVPSFLFQAQHTGTPWATAASPMMLIEAVGEFAGWEQHTGIAVFVVYCLMFGVLLGAVIMRAWPAAQNAAVAFGWRRSVPGSRLAGPAAAVFFVTMLLAMFGGMLAGAAFAYRYASVVMPFVILLVALGVVALGRSKAGRIAGAATLAVLAVLGTDAGAREIVAKRTEAVVVAQQLRALARPGDVVAYCPDQLGPAVSRLVPNTLLLTQVTFPRFDDPQRINWVDYAQVNKAANPNVFAHQVLNLAGDHTVWLVWEAGYRTLGKDCQDVRNVLRAARPDHSVVVGSKPNEYYEHENLLRFPAF
jgi:mannosyltransferase